MKANMADKKKVKGKNMVPRKIAFIGAAVILIISFGFGTLFGSVTNLGGWFADDDQNEDFEAAKPQLEQQLVQEKEQELITQHLNELEQESDIQIDLEDFDQMDEDTAVATVNGEEIREAEVLELEQQQKQQLEMSGMDPDSEEAKQMMEEIRPQILDNIITNTLLSQKAEEAGIVVDENEINEQYQMFAQQFGGEEEMEQAMEQEGMSSQDLKQEIAEQLLIQNYSKKYIEENLDEDELDFSEEELRELYELQQQEMQLQ
jgi:FKBP-type peptidyl-prolyl cis-trans isomerase (trigger factor)